MYHAAKYQKSTSVRNFLKNYYKKTDNRATKTNGHSLLLGKMLYRLDSFVYTGELCMPIAMTAAREDWGSARTAVSDGDKGERAKRNYGGEQGDAEGVKYLLLQSRCRCSPYLSATGYRVFRRSDCRSHDKCSREGRYGICRRNENRSLYHNNH